MIANLQLLYNIQTDWGYSYVYFFFTQLIKFNFTIKNKTEWV
jgi:hypothetical protein